MITMDAMITDLREQIRVAKDERNALSGRIRYMRHALENLEKGEARRSAPIPEGVESAEPAWE